ncbi:MULTISPECIES: M56 family metallopeptidase [unclassified Flavobacterium]|uniref:M56 family metallopeptidase n=1 Tax=unclassified Flavobacterium TaxID=196869 RepID=UPI00131C4591|nr:MULTISPECIES: M56 family metallopeptidase [unclassified Flavobacterium]
MEALYLYLIKSSGLLALFFVAYHFLLRKETFFTSNRWFLVLGLFTSVVLPLVAFTKIVWVEPSTNTIDWSQIPLTTSSEKDISEINWYLVIGMLYAIGMLLFILKLAFDFYSLHRVLKGKHFKNQADFKYIDTTENIAPFSFFKTIVYNSTLYSKAELENILEHEKVHSEQNHTVDVLISRLFCIVFWFNPFIWLYKKAILQNLEFIADSEATKKITDKKAYQFTLLKITTHENCVAITNHFYQSLIKKRIVMLNKNQSKKWNSWKYAVIVPALVAFVLLFQIEVIAQEKKQVTKENTLNSVHFELEINATSTKEELNAQKDLFKEDFGIQLAFTDLIYNSSNEIIQLKAEIKSNNNERKIYSVKGTTPIKPFKIFAKTENDKKVIFGFKADKQKNSQLSNHFKATEKNGEKIEIKLNEGNSGTNESNHEDYLSINNFKKDGVEYLLVINGVKQSKDHPIRLPFNDEIVSQTILESQEAIAKYGSDAANGACEIITSKTTIKNKKRKQKNSKYPENDDADIYTTVIATEVPELKLDKDNIKSSNNDQNTAKTLEMTFSKNQTNSLPKDVEYYINDKKVTRNKIEKLDHNTIERVDVDKSKNNTKIMKFYTKK